MQTYFRWWKKYGVLMPSEMKRLKQLEEENQRLKRLVADLSLDKEMLQEEVRKKALTSAWRRELGRRGPAGLAGEHPPCVRGVRGRAVDLPLRRPPSAAGGPEQAHPQDRRDPCAMGIAGSTCCCGARAGR